MMRKYLVTVSGEIVLKSVRTRPRFFKALIRNIEDALRREGVKGFKVFVDGARIFVEAKDEVTSVLTRVFGVYRVGEAVELAFTDLRDLAAKIAEVAREDVRGKKFAVRVHRVGTHDFTSMDVAREAGAALLPYSAGVDLTNPEVTVWVEVRGEKAYVYRSRARGPGGLPIGVEGRGLALFSGGFDSPVAAWYVARRGVEVHFLHFALASPQATYLAVEVAKTLSTRWLHGYRPRMYVIDFNRVVDVIRREVRQSYRQVVLRALMYRAGELLASKAGFDALITGEVIGQASSQTLQNLHAIENVVNPSVPIIRPLAGMDKEEIVEASRRIGTHDTSAKVFEACAIAPSMVTTRAKKGELTRELSKVPYDLVEKAVQEATVLDVMSADPLSALSGSSVEIDFIPERAIIVDVRPKDQWMKDGVPGSIHISEFHQLKDLRDRPTLLYCDRGNLSYLAALSLRKEGVRAFSFRGGIEALRKAIEKKGDQCPAHVSK